MGHQTHADQPQPVSKLSLEVEGGVAEKTRVSSVVTVIFAGVALMCVPSSLRPCNDAETRS
jgi:hypothetical protein